MNFENLYNQSKTQITEAIIGMWRDVAPKMVELYKDQLKDIVSKCISDNIVVENMAHWTTVENDDWKQVVDARIWRKYDEKGAIVDKGHSPYQHQYESWRALLNDENTKSIVVTSGTGSGKTECFMVPLIHDLTKDQVNGQRTEAVEAIFLYPLNALMEDQKERINNFITFSEKQLTFAVYNGNTPEDRNDSKWDYEVDDSNDVKKPFENEVLTRKEIRKDKPNILFTNPSMLEYMLLRHKDDELFTDRLKWIVIDETHTFKGSAGAELALLLRRVLKACGKDANDVKFATSSATIGNAPGAEQDLKTFISAITGHHPDNIKRIEGKRSEPATTDESIKRGLAAHDFILLKDLIPNGSIEEKLRKLDELSDGGLRVRLHYYLQSLNMGLYVDPRKVQDGKFVLTRTIPMDDVGKLDSHYLEAYYCRKCGALLGYGELHDNNEYRRRVKETVASLEELVNNEDDDDDDDGGVDCGVSLKDAYVGLSACSVENNPITCTYGLSDDGNRFVSDGSQFVIKEVDVKSVNGDTRVTHYCPCCGEHGRGKDKPVKSFHLSANYISRLIAPILLDQTSAIKGAPEAVQKLPRQGHKYITFADSRQSVAGPTLEQNLETEEVWVTGVLYNKLLECNKNLSYEIEDCKYDIQKAQSRGQADKIEELENKLRKLQSFQINGCYLTWNEVLDTLIKDDNFERMFLAFAKKYDKNNDEAKKKYALSALYRVMNRRPGRGQNSPENWGLISVTYPDLYKLKGGNNGELPPAINNFNALLAADKRISNKDWHDYVKLFVDYEIRGHQRFFFYRDDEGWDKIDYNATREYRTALESRRPIDGDKTQIKLGDNRYTKLLVNLLGKTSIRDLEDDEKDAIEKVIELLKSNLESCEIKEVGRELNWVYDHKERKNKIDGWKYTTEKVDDGDKKEKSLYYMNLSRIAFKLYDGRVWFDDNIRIPLDTTFKQYSPEYVLDNNIKRYDHRCQEIDWPLQNIPADQLQTIGDIKRWWQSEIPISHKWSSKLGRILEYILSKNNTIYIQAEHTAQVARSIISDKTKKFKNGEINIMACSTTMEMGVDLGDLEMVVMNNLPAHPANYKQRAGRAGRGDQNKSAVITICGSDASGSEMMENPLTHLICAPIEPPKIKLDNSPQIIQRHINSYLFRKFIKDKDRGINLMAGNDGENDRGYKVYKFFTGYTDLCYDPSEKKYRVRENDQFLWPSDYIALNNHNQSHYIEFVNNLNEWATKQDVIAEVEQLLSGALNSNFNGVQLINNAAAKIKQIADELNTELNELKTKWDNDEDSPENRQKKWNYMFTSLLGANLFSFLSTHQFTPNAHMPIGIVEMVINEGERHGTENPSRDMRVALSEYAPGRMVFINDVTYLIGGVRWNHAQSNLRLKRCVNNHTWLAESEDDRCPVHGCNQHAEDWSDGFGRYIHVITPTGFYPYKDTSRITKKEELDIIIDTALIGVGNWVDQGDNKRLYAVRTNDSDANAEILYYNKGYGRGYYVCKECGYAVPVPKLDNPHGDSIREALYPIATRAQRVKYYHNYRGWRCYYDKDGNGNINSYVFQNIVFGGTIQTDYCEIALYTSATDRMPYGDGSGDEVAITLGLMLCREFAHRIGCDRQEIDFIVRRQNAEMSICIYDTAKGGSGYSKKLSNLHLLETLFDVVRKKLSNCKSADDILDRTTMKYADKINVVETRKWLESEYEFRQIVPDEIQKVFSGKQVRVARYEELKSDVQGIQIGQNCTLFFDGERINSSWNFDLGDANWDRNRFELNGDNLNNQRTFAVTNLPPAIASKDEVNMLVATRKKPWRKFNHPFTGNGVFPLAQLGSKLYFTSNERYTLLDEVWAADDLYSVEYDTIETEELQIVKYGDEHHTYPAGSEITSDELFDKLWDDPSLGRFRAFINNCNGHELEFVYHEEYMRDHLTMTMALQFIVKFAKRANASIGNIKIIGEKYPYDDKGNLIEVETPYNGGDELSLRFRIYTPWKDYRSRDEYLKSAFMDKLQLKYEVVSLDRHALPHWRALIIKDTSTGGYLNILPNGGFGNEWKFDSRNNCTEGYWPNNCDINTRIPITTENGKDILYDIKVCDPDNTNDKPLISW